MTRTGVTSQVRACGGRGVNVELVHWSFRVKVTYETLEVALNVYWRGCDFGLALHI